jgi:hypothetical protein
VDVLRYAAIDGISYLDPKALRITKPKTFY